MNAIRKILEFELEVRIRPNQLHGNITDAASNVTDSRAWREPFPGETYERDLSATTQNAHGRTYCSRQLQPEWLHSSPSFQTQNGQLILRLLE
ncbi:hypothetical protein C0991_001560 [Blastosporella zonata]|nr:hypothetical protein C0991_001560 [Blastosporella zonata]